jgi:hypothetical protein
VPHPTFTNLNGDVVDAETGSGGESQVLQGLYVRGATATDMPTP